MLCAGNYEHFIEEVTHGNECGSFSRVETYNCHHSDRNPLRKSVALAGRSMCKVPEPDGFKFYK